ncbi:FAD:protein FMN transferase [Pelagicoccus mobilis]|uniref:FAD:protein FMN transferase n=1 Tax=Pelagicoccus mobilis TaxID=415221 RepID=A0A934RW30_9BACT|nr:FAD:protein FMN transferase [Pelagicoccus mobilis]MBK1877556.1 FAD:protein FMN transferase [Pelagicoccus mobilis]
MKRRQFVFGMFGAAAVGLCGYRYATGPQAPNLAHLVKVSKTGQALGTTVTITAYHADRKVARDALTEAFEAIERVEQTMSLYRPDSQLSKLNRDGFLANPQASLVQVLETALHLSVQSNGAFDVSIQPLWAAYEAASQQERLPTPTEIKDAKNLVNWQNIELSEEQISLSNKGMALTLNGIAQGYAADVAACALKAHGIEHALIDSGEISTVGVPAHKDNWTIGIKHPREEDAFLGVASFKGRCLATSGDYESHFTDDYEQHHLLDPRSGRSPQELSSVTVAAPTAMEADALSTAVFLMGLEKGKELIERLPNVDALFVDKANHTSHTTNFPIA